MAYYSDEFKEHTVRKLLPPETQSIAQVSRTTGVSRWTLRAWRNQYQQGGPQMSVKPSNPDRWDGSSKLEAVIETAAMNETQRAAYCRRQGLYAEQLQHWRETAVASFDQDQPGTAAQRQELKRARQKNRQLEKELVELKALVALAKKASAIWGERGDD